jgi:hypothetical protein
MSFLVRDELLDLLLAPTDRKYVEEFRMARERVTDAKILA